MCKKEKKSKANHYPGRNRLKAKFYGKPGGLLYAFQKTLKTFGDRNEPQGKGLRIWKLKLDYACDFYIFG